MWVPGPVGPDPDFIGDSVLLTWSMIGQYWGPQILPELMVPLGRRRGVLGGVSQGTVTSFGNFGFPNWEHSVPKGWNSGG